MGIACKTHPPWCLDNLPSPGLILSRQLGAPHEIFKRPTRHGETSPQALEAHDAADRRARNALDDIVKHGIEQSLVSEEAVEEGWRRDSLWLRIDVVHTPRLGRGGGGSVPEEGLGVVACFPPHLIVRRERGAEGGWGWYIFNQNVLLKSQ